MAWAQAKEAARIAAVPVAVKAARTETLRSELTFLAYRDDYRAACVRHQEIETELAALAA